MAFITAETNVDPFTEGEASLKAFLPLSGVVSLLL